MGTDYFNLQVRTDGSSNDCARVIESFRQAVIAEGLTEVEDHRPADWALAVSPPGPWVAVYGDDASEKGDAFPSPDPVSGTVYGGELFGWRLAERVSSEFPVVAYAVADSVIESGRLFHRGRLIDAVITCWTSDGQRRSGNAALWRETLGVRAGEPLEAALDAERSKPGMLERSLGWVPDLASVGYRWYDEGIPSEGFEDVLAWSRAVDRYDRRHWWRRWLGLRVDAREDPRFQTRDLPSARREIAASFNHTLWAFTHPPSSS